MLSQKTASPSNSSTTTVQFPVATRICDRKLNITVTVQTRINADGSMVHQVPSRKGSRPHDVSAKWCTCQHKAFHRTVQCWHQLISAAAEEMIREDCQLILTSLYGPNAYGDTRAWAWRAMQRMGITESIVRAVLSGNGNVVMGRAA
jgi:hypothetical protein